MRKTKIEWCDSTWNPVTGCKHDCPYCFAKRITNRFGGKGHGELHEINEPVYDADGYRKLPYPFGFDPTFHRYRLDDPGRIKNGVNIFVCSMADLFGEWVPGEWILEVLNSAKSAPQHNYLFLTKNPIRYMVLGSDLPGGDNFWYGTTVTKDSDMFMASGARNAFISIEPMLEPFGDNGRKMQGIRWAIMGAETGNRKEKVIPKKEWVEAVVETCDRSGIPVFMKDSLIPMVGEENMRREFPEELEGKT